MSDFSPLDAVDRMIIDTLQGDFPLSPTPYADAALALDISEDELLARIGRMLTAGILTRFGPLFQIERCGGAFVLAALQVREDDWETVCRTVNAFPEVAHNYRREHQLNMWFVVAAETREAAFDALARIEAATALKVHAFPKEREYFVELRLPVTAGVDHGPV